MKTIQKLSLLSLATICLTFTNCGSDDTDDTPDIIEEEIVEEETVDEDTIEITDTSILLHVDLDSQALYPMHFLEDGTTGTADIADAQELLASGGSVPITIKDGYIYVNDFSGSEFTKLEVSDEGILTEVASLPNLGTNGNPLYDFIDDETILLTSRQTFPTDGLYTFQLINVNSMTEETTGTLEIPIQGANGNADFSYMWANDYIYFEDNLYVPFIEVDANDSDLYDEAYVAVFDSNYNYVKTITTTKTSNVSTGFISSTGIDESGDLYISSSNISFYGNNEDLPSGIVRIKSGETEFDEDYFLDITELTGYHSIGMLYVEDGKAIVPVYNSDLQATSSYFVEYHLVDLYNNSVTKLNMPSGSGGYYGGRRSMSLMGNGNAAIMLNHENGNSVYIYDAATGTVSEGTTYTGADGLIGLNAFN